MPKVKTEADFQSVDLDEAAAAVGFLDDLRKNGKSDEIPQAALSHLQGLMAAFDAEWPYEPGTPFEVVVECSAGAERPYSYVVHADSPEAATEKARRIHDDETDRVIDCLPGIPAGSRYCWNDCRRKNIMLTR